jgi:hypothetical protein
MGTARFSVWRAEQVSDFRSQRAFRGEQMIRQNKCPLASVPQLIRSYLKSAGGGFVNGTEATNFILYIVDQILITNNQ